MVGQVKASGGLQTQLVSDRSSQIIAEGASGLGDAVNRLAQTGLGYLNSRTDIERIYDQRAMASQGLQLDTQFLQYQQDRAREFTEFSRGRSASPGGMTKEYDTQLATREQEFLKNVPERFREETTARLAQDRAQRVGSAFTAELELMDNADTNTLNQGLNTLGSGLKGGGVSLEDAEAEWATMVTKSGLPEETKKQFILNGSATLQGLELGTIVEQTALGYGTTSGPADGSDVVMAGALPQQRGVLNAIAANESSGYNIWNGGFTFEGYEDHPAASNKAPGESTAAGRYQFILGTWRAASASFEQTYGVKVPNFSPEWQDRVALHWAERQFNAHYKAATFKEILASGDPAKLLIIRDVLGKPRSDNPNNLEWKGLGVMGDAEFLEVMTGQKGIAGGGTGGAEGPNVWTDPQFANLSLDTKLGFANAAAAAAENQKQAMATAGKLERDNFLDQAYNAGYNGDPAMVDALKGSHYWDAEAQAKYNSGQEVFRKAEDGASTVGAALPAGTPLAATQAKDLGRWFGADSFAGIASGSEVAFDKMRWTVGQGKLFPEGSVDAFRAALGNKDVAPKALEFLASALAGDSQILRRSGFTQEDIADVQLFKGIAERASTQEKAFENYTKAVNREGLTGKSAAQLDDEAGDLFTKSYPTSSALVDNFDGWFSGRPNTALNENTEGQLMQDASTAFSEGYRIYGTAEGAEAYMQSSIDSLWGITQTKTIRSSWGPGDMGGEGTDGILMRHPPEEYYTMPDGDFAPLYTEIGQFAVAAGARPDNAVLMADDQTDKETREGKPPTYRVIGMGEFGEAIVLPGRFGGQAIQDRANATIAKGSLERNAQSSVGALRTNVIEKQNRLTTAQRAGAPPEELEKLQLDVAKAEGDRDSATLAATELGFITPALPDYLSDEAVLKGAEMLRSALATDNIMQRRVSALTAKQTGVAPAEARRLALIEIVVKEMKVSDDVAATVVAKMMEQK